MQFIKPARKTVGRYMDLTGKRKDIITGTDWGEVPGEFEGASGAANPFAIFRGNKTQFSVPVEQVFQDPPQSFKALIRGIPKWLESTQVYYCLLVYLAKYHLLMISGLEFVNDVNESTRAVWVIIDGTEEATRIFESQDYRLRFSTHKVFQLPPHTHLDKNEIELVAYTQSI